MVGGLIGFGIEETLCLYRLEISCKIQVMESSESEFGHAEFEMHAGQMCKV